MTSYYTEKLAAERLRLCYELAPPETRAYLEAEAAFVLDRTAPSMAAVELGCGYGRLFPQLVPKVRTAVGVDTSLPSLSMAQKFVRGAVGNGDASFYFVAADATSMAFPGGTFDLTICIQNGVCSFAVDKLKLFKEAVRVTRPGGTVLFSTYSARFWPHRLAWFEIQAANGLIGPIDYGATGNGVIMCKDGFRATTATPADFANLAGRLGLRPNIVEVAGSSLFCEIVVPRGAPTTRNAPQRRGNEDQGPNRC